MLIAEFAGRQIEGHRIDAARVHRYIRYAVNNGQFKKAKWFSPGSVVATPGVLEAFRASGDDPLAYLIRHIAGDWGDVDEHDRNENEISLQYRWRLLSAYTLSTGVKFWIIAEAMREATTNLVAFRILTQPTELKPTTSRPVDFSFEPPPSLPSMHRSCF
jgi:hypothetical protein